MIKFHWLQARLFLLVTTILLLHVNFATAKPVGLQYFRQLDSLRYFTFTKDTPAVAKYLKRIANSEPTYYNDLYLMCKAYVMVGDTAMAALALERAVEMGMPISYIQDKSASISGFMISNERIDLAYKKHQKFQKIHQADIDSMLYFLANDLKLYGNGNETGGLVIALSKYIDPNLKSHDALQKLLTSYIIRNGWVGYRQTHRSDLLLPVAHLSQVNLDIIHSRITQSLHDSEMLPDEYGFIEEKRYQHARYNMPKGCKYAPSGFRCPEKWSSDIKMNRMSIGMSVFFFRKFPGSISGGFNISSLKLLYGTFFTPGFSDLKLLTL